MRRILLVAFLVLAGASAPAQRDEAASEPNVRPGINDSYLSPDLDVDVWVERFEGESREIFVQRREIVAALGLRPGMAVADLGAGTGLFMPLLAEGVGAEGRVYAVDIAPKFLAHLKQRAAAEGLSQVEVVEGKDRSPGLADASVDLIFVCDVYHHFEYPRTMLASLRRVLRPGGTLVLIDFEKIPGKSREFILEHVRAGKAVFVDEIEDAGFELQEELAIEGLVENYALRFRNP